MKKYLFDNKTYTDTKTLEDAVHLYAFRHLDEWIDTIYGYAYISDIFEYRASSVLKNVDPKEYDEFLSRYLNELFNHEVKVVDDEKKYEFRCVRYTEEELEEAVHAYAYQHFDEYLDDIYGPVNIMDDLTYPTSRVLKDVDPTAYKCYLSDYENSLYKEAKEG